MFQTDKVWRSLDDAVTAGSVARPSERAAGAVLGFVPTVCLEMAGLCSSALIAYVSHPLPHRTGVGVGLLVVREFVGVEWVLLLVVLSVLVLFFGLFFIEVAILNIGSDPVFFQIQVVLFAPVSGICC